LARFNPRNILSSYSATEALNANFADIQELFSRVVFRDGTDDNAFLANADLNHFKLNNVAEGASNTDGVNLGQVVGLINTIPKGDKGDPGSAGDGLPTRAALAAFVATDGDDASLLEEGRAGKFVFHASSSVDLSAKVAADTEQGIYIPGLNGVWVRVLGIDTWLNPEWFGLSTAAGSDDANRLLIPKITATMSALGYRTLAFPAKTYRVGYIQAEPVGGTAASVYITQSDITFILYGTKLIGKGLRLTAIGDRFTLRGGLLVDDQGVPDGYTTTTTPSTYLLDLRGADHVVDGTFLLKDPEITGGYIAYIRGAATGLKMRNVRFGGGNGIYVQGTNHVFSDMVLIANATGGDDGFALKAPGVVTRNITISNVVMTGFASMLSIGSEVGNPLSQGLDPAYRWGVANVNATGLVGYQCAKALYIKPGAIATYPYMDGTVEDINVSAQIYDPTGSHFENGVIISPARGARVRRIRAKVLINARAAHNGSLGVTAGIYMPLMDYRSRNIGGGVLEGEATAAPSISDVEISLRHSDPLDAQDYDVTLRPSYPMQHVARIEQLTDGYGIMSKIKLDIESTGSKETGIFVKDGLDDAVIIQRAILTNASRNPVTAAPYRGGIFSLSNIRLDGKIEFGGTTVGFPIGGTDAVLATTAYTGREVKRQIVQIGSAAAGTAIADRLIWSTPRRKIYITSARIVNGVAIGGSSTNNTTVTLKVNGSSIASLTTTATLAASTETQMHTGSCIRSANALNIGPNTPIQFSKTDAGTGAALTDAVLVIEYVETGV
jgi:hypothetical protein